MKVLEEGRETSRFDAERDNIDAAIEGYRSGEIPYSREYTVIWAGKIMETFESYAAFTSNRTELLDRYVKDRGHGWLWWEPPLDLRANEQVQLQRCAELARECGQPNNMGHYRVKQGYWKRFDWVARLPGEEAFEKLPVSNLMHSGMLACLEINHNYANEYTGVRRGKFLDSTWRRNLLPADGS